MLAIICPVAFTIRLVEAILLPALDLHRQDLVTIRTPQQNQAVCKTGVNELEKVLGNISGIEPHLQNLPGNGGPFLFKRVFPHLSLFHPSPSPRLLNQGLPLVRRSTWEAPGSDPRPEQEEPLSELGTYVPEPQGEESSPRWRCEKRNGNNIYGAIFFLGGGVLFPKEGHPNVVFC